MTSPNGLAAGAYASMVRRPSGRRLRFSGWEVSCLKRDFRIYCVMAIWGLRGCLGIGSRLWCVMEIMNRLVRVVSFGLGG